MKEIKLTKGKVALVDDEDFEFLSNHSWYFAEQGYACSRINYKLVYMHRYIMNAKDNEEIDHRDGNGLNNQRSNLRKCNSTQNKANQRKKPIYTSKLKGVYWDKSRNKWNVIVTKNRKRYWLGRYDDEEEAGRAYDKKAKELFGEFACLNFP